VSANKFEEAKNLGRSTSKLRALFFFGTLAALFNTILELVFEVGDGFEESGHRFSINAGWQFNHAGFNVLAFAFATFLFVLNVTSRLGALQLALGARASSGLGTRPRARGLFTKWSTVGFRSNTSGVALGRSANSLALRARFLFAHVLGTTNRTFGLFTVDCAFGTFGLLTLHLAFRASANRMTNSRARRVVTLPSTSWVAIGLSLATVNIHFGFRLAFNLGGDGHSQDTEQNNSFKLHCS